LRDYARAVVFRDFFSGERIGHKSWLFDKI
jgi:hypothetical protein